MFPDAKKDIISKLQKDILQQEGYRSQPADIKRIPGLENIEAAFPGRFFPTGAIHEFLSFEPEHGAASGGFIAGLLGALMKQGGACLWISTARKVFPVALRTFGVSPDRIIFVNVQYDKEALWVMEEALKCKGLAGIVAEVRELTFMQSRRLQLAVETSHVTGRSVCKKSELAAKGNCHCIKRK